MKDYSHSISFVILTWNSEEYIIQSLDSIFEKCSPFICEIFIIDNGSKDNTVQSLVEHYRDTDERSLIKIIQLDKNYGTTISRNIGLRKASGQFIIIMDSDTEIVSGNLTEMLTLLDGDNSIGILAPLITYPNGIPQHSCKKFPTFPVKLLKLLQIFDLHPMINHDFYKDFPFKNITQVETAISAFWLFKKEFIKSIGLLDEHIFYAPEDVDYCVRSWLNGNKVVFYPNFKIIHHTQQITHTNPFSSVALKHLLGLIYYFKKYKYWFSREKLRNKIRSLHSEKIFKEYL